ncbi:LIC_10190 family membrane protein [Flaviaesturariibacter flavus]
MLLAWIYITLLCRGWGAGLRALMKDAGKEWLPDAVLPFLGLGAVGTVVGIASLVMPLGGPGIQILLVTPPLLYLFFRHSRSGIRLPDFSAEARPYRIAWLACALLFLLMGSWEITHPDTLAYHTATIRWIEGYQAIRGLVHLNHRLGYQGLWYQLCAAFSFRFAGGHALSYLPPVFALWCAGYLLHGARAAAEKHNALPALLWLGLLAYLLCDYNALRLTAASAGNDLAAAAFVWLSLHLFLRGKGSLGADLAVTFFALFATAIKLSAAPVLLLPLLRSLAPGRRGVRIAVGAFFGILVLGPLLVRNILTTGYPLFPSPLAGFDVDWKLAPEAARYELRYVMAWARSPWLQTGAEVEAVLHSPVRAWMPRWWAARSGAEQVLLLTLIPSLPVALLRLRRGADRQRRAVVFAVAFLGLVYWWLQAPDPRFGLGSILAIIALAWYPFGGAPAVPQRSVIIACVLLTLGIGSYSGYRFAHYFRPAQLLQPIGVREAAFEKVKCQGVDFYRPQSAQDAERPLPLPSLTLPCNAVRLRGARVEEGFRAP